MSNRQPEIPPDIDTEVLVVGAGPVGLALAGDLGWRGHRCLFIDQGDGVIGQPRMDLVGLRTMEFCRRWGIVPDVEATPYDRDYPQDNVYLTTLNGYELGRHVMPSMRAEQPPPESPQKRERCPQNMFDPVLQKFALSQPGVDSRYGTRLLSFEEDDRGVTSRLLDGRTGATLVVRSRYLVGCDGGRSFVRESLGIGMKGRGVLTHTTNVIFCCAEFNALHDKAPGYRYMFVGPNGTWATIVAINGRDQWRMSIIGSRTERVRYSNEELKQFAIKALGRSFDPEILSVLRWTRTELVADHYGKGRVLIAGDACHLTSPTGGLGMNTGIGDAVDLSWKLSASLQGWGGPALLQSYEIERRPIAHRITQFSTGNLQIMKQTSSSERILEAGPEGDVVRREVGKALTEGLMREWYSLNMHLGNRYLHSPVISYDETEDDAANQREFEDAMNYRPSTRPGVRAPHAWLPDGRSTLDLFGRTFVMLRLGEPRPGDDAAMAGFKVAAADAALPLDVVQLTEPHIVALYETRFVLVRPDGHVAWRGNALPARPLRVIGIVTGTVTQTTPAEAPSEAAGEHDIKETT